jgi:hypothetical protein
MITIFGGEKRVGRDMNVSQFLGWRNGWCGVVGRNTCTPSFVRYSLGLSCSSMNFPGCANPYNAKELETR